MKYSLFSNVGALIYSIFQTVGITIATGSLWIREQYSTIKE